MTQQLAQAVAKGTDKRFVAYREDGLLMCCMLSEASRRSFLNEQKEKDVKAGNKHFYKEREEWI